MMKRELLMKYAEQGVRDRLQVIQLEINELARNFPHIVCNADGTVPVVAAIQVTKANKVVKNTKISNHQRNYWNSLTPAKKKKKIAQMLAARKAKQAARA